MLGRIKYWLLEWLIRDICGMSRCKRCRLAGNEVCYKTYICDQACKVWGL